MILVKEKLALQPKKAQEAAPYKTKFNPAWTKELPFIGPVTGDVYRYMLGSYL